MDIDELKRFFIDVLDETFGPRPVEIGAKWQNGSLILRPGNDTQEKDVPIEVFFKKLLSVRDSLRVLEQKINSSPSLTLEEKTTFQSYITKAYGSMTTFNILFKDEKNKFQGVTVKERPSDSKMTMAQAKKKLGLNEY